MQSKWFEYKAQSIALRKQGASMTLIEKKWGIPRSTQSGWFKNIILTKSQKNALIAGRSKGFEKARKYAVIWHKNQKKKHLLEAKNQALAILNSLDLKDKYVLELALAVLYMGEGAKSNTTSIGNTNPLILKFFIKCLENLYSVNKSSLKCSLHIRSDQNCEKLKRYWSRELKIPLKNFGACLVDKRTVKSKTYPHYKGVCVVRTSGYSIQRRLVFLSNLFCDKIVNTEDD